MSKLPALLLLVLVAGCDRQGPNESSLGLVVKASPARARGACTVSVNGGTENGNCFTPTSVSAHFSSASLSDTVKIVGGGDKYHGLESVFRTERMDLNAAPRIEGDDNLQNAAGSSFNELSFAVRAMETVFTGTAGGRVFRVRHFFVDQPPSSSSTFSARSCGFNSENFKLMDRLGRLYEGSAAEPRRGDIMVCVKDAGESCAETDYRWVEGGSLVGARSANTKRLAGALLTSSEVCPVGGADTAWSALTLAFGLTTPVSLSARVEGGKKIYTTADGKSGTRLTVTVEIPLTDSLFLHHTASMSDLATATEPQILANLDKLMLKPVYVMNTRTGPEPAAAMSAAVTTVVE